MFIHGKAPKNIAIVFSCLIAVLIFDLRLHAKEVDQKDELKTKSSAILKQAPQINKSSSDMVSSELKKLYGRSYSSKVGVNMLKERTLKHAQASVPVLIEVMKSSEYPDNNRWIATFMLGRIMGKESGEFISKFTQHPNWMLRLASLKTLLALDQRQYTEVYAQALKDDAIIIRLQALENIKLMQLNDLAPHVWSMLYDETNYIGKDGQKRRQDIIKKAIKLVGDLQFGPAKDAMNKMAQSQKYKDIHAALSYALKKLN